MTNEELKAKEQESTSFNLEELLLLMLSKWYWFLFAVIIALSAAVFKILTTAPIYTRTTQLLIKDEQSGKNTSTLQEFTDLGLISSSSNIVNETATISAPILMEEVAQRLHLDVQMTVPQRLYERPLYNDAPVMITLGSDIENYQSFSFTLSLGKNKRAHLSNITVGGEETGKSLDITLGQNVRTPFGTICITPTTAYDDRWFGDEIKVTKIPVSVAGAIYSGRLSVAQSDKESTILNLTLSDEVPERASDVLKTLIDVYNEDWLKDKNRIAESTSDFITERLNTLAQELGDVDRDISDYKSQNLLPDVAVAGGIIMNQSTQNYNQILNLNNQISMAQYLEQHMRANSELGHLLPSNTLQNAGGTESLIQAYNQTTLRRNEMLANSSDGSPIVQN